MTCHYAGPRFIATLVATLTLVLGGSGGVSAQGFRLLGIALDTLLATKTPRLDRAFVTTYYQRPHLYLVSDRQNFALHVPAGPKSLTYKPDLGWNLGAGIDYKWIGGELSFRSPFLGGYNTARRGLTHSFGIAVNVNNRRFWLTNQYQFYRGFYLSNPDSFGLVIGDPHGMYPYRADLSSHTFISNGLYLFNPLRVSLPATLFQKERQRRTAGSWLVGGRLTYQHIRGDSSWIPPAGRADAQPESQLLRINGLSLGADAGYMHTFVFRAHYFVNYSLRPGLAVLVQQNRTVTDPSAYVVRLGWYGVAAFTVGYTSDRYYGGVYGSAALLNRGFGTGLVTTDMQYLRFVVGRRFRYQPKGLLKQVPGL